jgi:hypothetical protein
MLEEMMKLEHHADSTTQRTQSVRRIAAVTDDHQIFNLHHPRLERL